MNPLQRRALLLAPIACAAVGGTAMAVLLQRLRAGAPRHPPDPMLGKRVPQFALPGLPGGEGFDTADVLQHAPLLLNFFASWCLPCAQETTELLRLKQRGLPIWGVVYQDKPQSAAAFLQQNGNPYRRVAVDQPGLIANDFDLHGVPETYLVDRQGILRWRWAGGLSRSVVRDWLDPLLKTYL